MLALQRQSTLWERRYDGEKIRWERHKMRPLTVFYTFPVTESAFERSMIIKENAEMSRLKSMYRVSSKEQKLSFSRKADMQK